ncbi:MAG: hypothetical protein WC661_09660 [Opitutaceae bacterium]|jgi:hypothetical protein
MSRPPHISRFKLPARTRRRGSVLIVALLLASLIAVGLASYINLNLTSSRLARRTFTHYAALNLTEAGTEEAVWSFNRVAGGHSDGWDGWTNDGTAAWKKFSGFDFGSNTTGSVKVYVTRYNAPSGVSPKIVALASVSPPGQPAVSKMLELTLRRRSYFSSALVAKKSIVFNGAVASVDSWNSDPDNDALTAAIPYSNAVRTDHGSVASVSVDNTAVLVKQANIWGYVATGGAQPQVGVNGTIQGADTPAGVAVDPSRVSTDFNADFPTVTAPTDGTPIASVGATLGTAGQATRWRITSISLTGKQSLTILGDVTLILTASSGASALSVTGSASIIIPSGSSLTVYAEGDIKIAGNGLGNSNTQPVTCIFWGTNQSVAGQTIQIAGNGALKAIVYAPNANVTLNGNGDMMGSVVANDITLNGNAAYHYDESLANYGPDTPYGIAKWREVSTSSEQSAYLGYFQGW